MRTIAILAALLLAATAHAASYKCQDKNGKWSEAACTGTAAPPQKPVQVDWEAWKPRIGMTIAEVESVLNSAGRCCVYNPWLSSREVVKNRTTTQRGEREQWVFRHYGWIKSTYLYFDDGILTSIQD
ncbi:MAG: hypothetical protein JSS28_06770 [Proteobacteria bacterium]|nr:hypothetical protein [Pseudomonadota bacterium]